MRVALLRYIAAFLFSVPMIAAEPPSVLWNRFDTKPTPVFIAAAAMVRADGAPSPIVPEAWRIQQQRYSEVVARAASKQHRQASVLGLGPSAAPCGGGMLLETPLEPMVNRTTLPESIANARAIVDGTIRSVTPGFFYGFPAARRKPLTNVLRHLLRECPVADMPARATASGSACRWRQRR